VIEKFNFYDIYGYLLPGLFCLAVFWLPFGIVCGIWPPKELASALLLVLAAYFLGHVLQMSATLVVPSKIPDKFGRNRFPSDSALDGDNTSYLSGPIKMEIQRRATLDLNSNLEMDRPTQTWTAEYLEEVDRGRNSAFFIYRYALLKNKAYSYAEQFQGLYAMMRGLAAVSFLAFWFYLGWAFGPWPIRIFISVEVWLLVALLLLLTMAAVRFGPKLGTAAKNLRIQPERWIVGCLFAICFFSGVILARKWPPSEDVRRLLVLCSVILAFLSLRFFGSYQEYARNFALAIWREVATAKIAASLSPKEQKSSN
jgi:hypothetical protein